MRSFPREVRPEILDGLPPGDPEAQRSRRDLRTINFLMGNVRWACREADALPGPITEIGAGEGLLCQALRNHFPWRKITGVDLVPRPSGLSPTIHWRQGDLMDTLNESSGGILMGVMILHHFNAEQLARIGDLAGNFGALCFCEPLRSRLSHLWGNSLLPIVGEVTRHDMPVSIDAGFQPGELVAALKLSNSKWDISETTDFRGSLRVRARRK